MPYDSQGTLVFWCQKYRRNSNKSPPTEAPNRDWIDSIGDFQPISRYVSETVQDRDIVTIED